MPSTLQVKSRLQTCKNTYETLRRLKLDSQWQGRQGMYGQTCALSYNLLDVLNLLFDYWKSRCRLLQVRHNVLDEFI